MLSLTFLGVFLVPMLAYIWLILKKRICPNLIESLIGGTLIGFLGPLGLLYIILMSREVQNPDREFRAYLVDLFEE